MSKKLQPKLSPKQARFIHEYLICLNATQAYKAAGYTAKTDLVARVESARLLAKPNIALAIEEARNKQLQRLDIKSDAVVKELVRIGMADMKDFAEWDEKGVTLKPSAAVDGRCIAEVIQTETEYGKNIRIKLHPKTAALELLGKHFGVFEEDNRQKRPLLLIQNNYGPRPNNGSGHG